MNFLRGVMGGQSAGPQHTEAETIQKLCDRVASSTLLDDRRNAVRALKSLSKKYRLEVGIQAMEHLIHVLQTDRSDSEIIAYALDTLYNIISNDEEEEVEENSTKQSEDLGSQFTEIFIKQPENVTLLLSLLEEFDFHVRWPGVRLLTSLLKQLGPPVQQIILVSPMGVSRLMDLLADSREIIRNDGVLLLQALTRGNGAIQKIVAFENAFERLLDIITEEGNSDGGIVVEDCLILLQNLLKNNNSNQNFFKEGSYIQRMKPWFEVGDENSGWSAQKVTNLHLMLQLVRVLVSPTNPPGATSSCQKAMFQCGLLQQLCTILMATGIPADILTETINTVSEVIRGCQVNQDYFASVNAPSNPPRPAIVVLLMSMVNERQPFVLRCAVLYCFQCFLYKNQKGQGEIVATLLPSTIDATGNSVSAGQLHWHVRLGSPLSRSAPSWPRRLPAPRGLRKRAPRGASRARRCCAPVGSARWLHGAAARRLSGLPQSPAWGPVAAWPAGWVCLVSPSPLPSLPPLPPPFSPPSRPIHWAAARPRPSSAPASPPPPPLMSISALLSMGRCCCRCCCPRGLWMLSAPCCDDRRMCVCPGPRRIGIPVRTSSLPLFSDAMPAPTQLFFPLLRNCELSRIYGTACYCHHKHLCCSPPCIPQNRLRYTPHPAYATFSRPRENWWQYTQGRRYASTPQKFYLTPPQVNSILKANEYSFKVPEFDGKNVSSVLGFDSNQLPANAPIEDRRSAATCLQTRGMLLGVFDGHAGCACSQAVSERLFYYIAVSLLPHETLLEIENAVESGRALLPILQWHKHPNDYFSKEASKLYFNSLRTYWQELIDLNTGESADIDVKEALINAFKRLDNDISLEAQVGDPNSFLNYLVLRVAFSGATACVAHVDGVDLHVANTGDSRAMLGVQEEDGSWSAVTLSNDHNAQNERELERLKLEHPKNEAKSVVKQDRLLGLLMPFRAFGDVKFKWSIDLQKRVIESGPDQLNDNEYTKFIPPNYHTPPYLTAEPEVTYHRLRPQDKFLVLATDGLWETMHRQDVVRIVGEYLTGMHHQQPIAVGGYKVTLGQMHGLLTERRAKMSSVFEDQNAATHLIRHAVGNNEFGAVDHERLSKMLSLPEELARMYRDDITIIVVQFNSHVVGAYQNQEH